MKANDSECCGSKQQRRRRPEMLAGGHNVRAERHRGQASRRGLLPFTSAPPRFARRLNGRVHSLLEVSFEAREVLHPLARHHHGHGRLPNASILLPSEQTVELSLAKHWTPAWEVEKG